ncbi:bifunctional diguanylate cyclase/phosphodiesterase [Teichococcus wenyumeiae]|uniref:bifunctional diguanylate cyclase/phosphodiesterase n=1 Tax=Teichococcus wenyumeiae TaxID=2478470 RepID=UPI001314C220|nr:EAL domain-containing protein [Pseudoroseomonas wenyumeiae]
MPRVFSCLAEEHDPTLILLALAICLSGAAVSMALLRRGAETEGWSRAGWLLLGSVAGGAFVWCTHFIAMLAYQPAASLGFSPLMTLWSLLLAILGWGMAGAVAVAPWRGARLLGGAGMGLAIGLMHYAGMAALGHGGIVEYDPAQVAASLLLGSGFGMLALRLTLRGDRPWQQWLGPLCLSLAVAALHFTGMAAVAIIPLDAVAEPVARSGLALTVAAVGLLVMAAAAAAWMIDHRTRAEARSRLRSLADSALEGLAVVREGRIVEANDTFAAMLGRDRAALLGQPLPGALLFPPGAAEGREGVPVEGRLNHANGSTLEVEVVVREDMPSPGLRVFAFRDLRERREHERRILHLAVHDPLTGLPNRARFAQRMEQVLKAAERRKVLPTLAVLHLGLDRFQEVNDLHGHAGGDALLRGIGRRIAQAVPPRAFAARLGSDEFGVLLPFTEAVEVFDLITRLERLLAEPSYIGGAEVSVTASTGVALFPADARGGEELRASADLAMRRAKASPARGLSFYHAEMDAAERYRRRMKDDLRIALAEGQFHLDCQVQVDLRSGETCGHEMLLRWNHPERGPIPPAEFIPLAEESGLILPIGDWVLREACALAVANPQLGKVAVNLSAVQFSQPDLPRQVEHALASSGLPAERLELEITESMLMQDRSRTLPLLERIKALGVRVAMDDFGTGYSSLGTLRSFPFDKIKLDRSFMAELDTSPQAVGILRAVIGIGRALRIPVLAEGVETQSQLEHLRAEGCDEVQGYLFGRPIPVPGQERAPSEGGTMAA